MDRSRAVHGAPRHTSVAAVLWAAVAHGADLQAPAESNREARQLVRQSLRSERIGGNARRESLLVKALETEPNLATAHWHTGRLMVDGQWRSIAQVQRQAVRDANLTNSTRSGREDVERRESHLAYSVTSRSVSRQGLCLPDVW